MCMMTIDEDDDLILIDILFSEDVSVYDDQCRG